MKVKIFPLLATMLCMSAFFLPVTAYAAVPEDRTPPIVDAWLTGDILHAEASDRDSGVEAIYVNGHRIGYLVDGAVEVDLEDVAGDGEHVTVYAVDFAGNKSSEAKVKNPYYTAPATTPAQTPTTPAPTPAQPTPAPSTSQPQTSTGGQTVQPPATSQPSTTPPASSTPEPESEPTPTPEPSESALPDDSSSNPFTPDGTGSVQDNATEQDGKEFFTIVTEAENTFYLVIDRQRDSEGVYLLNAVTEDDLMALAEDSGGTPGESAIPTPEPVQPTPEPTPTPEPEPEPEASGDGGMGTFIFIVLAALAVGGVGYYFKILKPKRDAAITIDEDDDEDDEGEDSYMDEGDSDGYEEYGDDFSDDSDRPDDTEYEFEREDTDDENGGGE